MRVDGSWSGLSCLVDFLLAEVLLVAAFLSLRLWFFVVVILLCSCFSDILFLWQSKYKLVLLFASSLVLIREHYEHLSFPSRKSDVLLGIEASIVFDCLLFESKVVRLSKHVPTSTLSVSWSKQWTYLAMRLYSRPSLTALHAVLPLQPATLRYSQSYSRVYSSPTGEPLSGVSPHIKSLLRHERFFYHTTNLSFFLLFHSNGPISALTHLSLPHQRIVQGL